jgi:hypothetical protein
MLEIDSLSSGIWQMPIKRTLRRLRWLYLNSEYIAESRSRLTESSDMVNAELRRSPLAMSLILILVNFRFMSRLSDAA